MMTGMLGVVMWLMMGLMLVGIVTGGVAWAMRRLRGRSSGPRSDQTPEEILRRRSAASEIDRDEYPRPQRNLTEHFMSSERGPESSSGATRQPGCSPWAARGFGSQPAPLQATGMSIDEDVDELRGDEMAEQTPVVEQPLVENQTATPWSEGRQRLETPERERICWLATVSPDGRPHVRPILGLWLDRAFYFITAETTRKGRNLAADPRCVIAASSAALPAVDVIVEGDAFKVTDQAKVRRVADAYASRLHWPLEVRGGAVLGPNAPTAGPPPYAVFELTPRTVFGLPGIARGEEGEGQAASFSPTRWRF
jgi:hypothetical protein